MSSPLTLWKASLGIVIYVLACISIVCFSAPDFAAVAGPHCTDQPGKAISKRAIVRALALD